ncbi:DUF1989 domain-containing protein, partial [Pantoea agglomerans]|nr:DUF1989 domain-containing protein [Pantoea agglomerans]
MRFATTQSEGSAQTISLEDYVSRMVEGQEKIYYTTGSVLYSNLGNPLLTIVADTCGRHDTLGGACSQESNTVR